MKTELEVKTRLIGMLETKIFLLEGIVKNRKNDEFVEKEKQYLEDLQKKIDDLEWVLKG